MRTKSLCSTTLIVRASFVGIMLAFAGLLVFGFLSDSNVVKQIGAMALLLSALCTPLFFVNSCRRTKILRSVGGIVVFICVFYLGGEVILRIVYSEGESFSSHVGPMVNRFERDFRPNRYNGLSRGSEISMPFDSAGTRVLVQGDSITWGQGVKDEAELYTVRVLSELRKTDIHAEMAVLARPGWEIDDHLEQLRTWGNTLMPDVVIYQWLINDMELDKSLRPRADWIWRRSFIHSYMVKRSYLWFFLDYNANNLLSPSGSYPSYLLEHYSEESSRWREFSDVFTQWCDLALETTPRVLVVLYPQMALPSGSPPEFTAVGQGFVRRVSNLCANVNYLNLTIPFAQFDDARDMKATRFDRHPSAVVHAVMAKEIVKTLQQLWPEIFSPDGLLVH